MSALAPRAKYPSVKFDTMGKRYAGTVAMPPESRQARVYNSTELATWPSGDPVMETRIILDLDNEGGRVAIYAKRTLATAITKALVDAEAPDIEVGGRLVVGWMSNDPESKNPANPRKVYEATYTPPAGDDWDPGDID